MDNEVSRKIKYFRKRNGYCLKQSNAHLQIGDKTMSEIYYAEAGFYAAMMDKYSRLKAGVL